MNYCPSSCHISRPGGADVDSPQGACGRKIAKTEYAAGTRSALRGRERPIPQVLQAGQGEIGAGAGAVAVAVTREELDQSFLIGQVRGVRAAGSEKAEIFVGNYFSSSLKALYCLVL